MSNNTPTKHPQPMPRAARVLQIVCTLITVAALLAAMWAPSHNLAWLGSAALAGFIVALIGGRHAAGPGAPAGRGGNQ